MSLPRQTVSGDFFRFWNPRWACEPLSGLGAAKTGDRFNERGTEALYFSTDVATAWREYTSQDETPLHRPATLVVYRIEGEGIIDLARPEVRSELSVGPDDLLSDWRALLKAGREPPTWRLSRELIGIGVPGILVPSAESHGANLVLWVENLEGRIEITVHDPRGELPRSHASWEGDRHRMGEDSSA